MKSEIIEVAKNYIKENPTQQDVLILDEQEIELPIKRYLQRNVKVLVVSKTGSDVKPEYYVSFEMGYGSDLIDSV